MIRPQILPLLLVTGLVCACAAQGPFPSLAPRAMERELSGQPLPPCLAGATAAPAPAPAAAPVDDAQLAGRLSQLIVQARQGEADFASALPAARASAARAGAAGSETWIAAQQDISRLEAARARTVDALAELEALSLSRSGDRATSEADRASVVAAAEEVRGLAEAQQAEIGRLSAGLSGPSALLRAPLQAPHNAQRPTFGRQALAASDPEHISPGGQPRADRTGPSCRG